MASLDGTAGAGRGLRPEQAALLREWKRLSTAATFVAVMTAPAFLLVLVERNDWPLGWSLIVPFFAVIAFRGLMDLVAHRLIPRPSLYGADKETLLDDATARRRVWFLGRQSPPLLLFFFRRAARSAVARRPPR